MEKNLYIDASHPNETRVVLKTGDNIEDYEYEGLKNNLIKNNIFLGKVSRVEPSLQAAFIDFGREWMLMNPTSRSLTVVYLVRMFPKSVFSPNVSSLRVLVSI